MYASIYKTKSLFRQRVAAFEIPGGEGGELTAALAPNNNDGSGDGGGGGGGGGGAVGAGGRQ
jgi:hypothetical protein